MRRIASAILSAAIFTAVAGCADDGYRSRGHGQASFGVTYQDGYYDNFYGSFHDGYWGGDGFFYFREAPDRSFRRDEGRHFRRDNAPGHHKFSRKYTDDRDNRRDGRERDGRERGRD